MRSDPLSLTNEERTVLERRVRSRGSPAGEVRVAGLLLLLADGLTYEDIQRRLDCTPTFIAQWKKRFAEQRLAGLHTRHRGRIPQALTPKMEARILSWTRRKPLDGSTHWSTRKLAKRLGVHHMMVQRTWHKAGLKPHRIERYMASNDPDFERKAADIIGLYVKPPQHAAVFCIDEKTAIQALDRKDPVLPLSPGRAERHGFEYYRHGTLSLYAAFNTKTGEVVGKTTLRHTSHEFVSFLEDLLAHHPKRKQIHIILDNLSAHKTKRVQQFLDEHPNVHFHFTPTYSSWLNQIETWFSKIERDVIARGVFTSVKDLARKLMRYVRHYNKSPKTIKWKYTDPSRRITPNVSVTFH